MRDNAIKFEYIKSHWELRDDIIYSKKTGKPISFSCTDGKGHSSAIILVNGKKYNVCIHNSVWMLFHNKPLPDGDFEVHHIDLNPESNAPDNLVLMSHRMHNSYHNYISGAKCYYYEADLKSKPWHICMKLPIGRRIQKRFATEAEAIAEVARHRAPILKAFKELGLPV